MNTHVQRLAHHTRRGFTLVEVLIVVVILGILAAIVVPQFSSASQEARDNSLQATLHRVRTQIEVYKVEHNDTLPALADFEAQMTAASDVNGNTAPKGTVGYNFGPYLSQMPVNPKTETAVVDNSAIGNSAWYYNETTGEFRANDSAESALY